MKIELEAYNNGGSVFDSVGRATFTAETDQEALVLRLISGGDIWSKARILFAMRCGLTTQENDVLTPLVERTAVMWLNYIENGVEPTIAPEDSVVADAPLSTQQEIDR